jgi:signal transduction histidine kinase
MTEKMKQLLGSIYVRFTAVFLGGWWLLNAAMLTVVIRVITIERLIELFPYIRKYGGEFNNLKLYTILAFVASTLLGTAVIILIARGIVKPIRRLSAASRQVATGDFDVLVTVNGTDELSRLAADFNTMVRELGSIDRMRGDFVSSVSHEFRTPITSIKGYVELLREDAAGVGELDAAQKMWYCDIILGESDRLIALSRDLLRLSELGSQVIREKADTFSLDEQIRKAIVVLEPQWSKKNIEFHLDMDKADYTCEKDLLQQVWMNLLHNAIKFSEDSGAIHIVLTNEGGRITVGIQDHGPGIPQEEQERIFNAFYKADRSRKREGNGLGLIIVKRIVDIMHGGIRLESLQGEGTTFLVDLPATKEYLE